MRYEHITDACFAAQIGESGLTPNTYEAALESIAPALEQIRRWHESGERPFLNLPENTADLDAIERTAAKLRDRFARLVIFGIGGSSLGGQALCALRAAGGEGPALEFLENPDPVRFEAIMASGDLAETAFLVISKSGSTAETLAQAMLALEVAEPDQFLFVAEAGDNPLRRLAQRFGIETLDHDPALGGRYSVLSLVGLLPALVAGLDARAARAGAAEVLRATLAAERPQDSAPAIGAAIGLGLGAAHGVSNVVLMPYVDRLHLYGLWFRQLWAESLGKDGRGTTPILARGAVDQHSQLQLYLDGPRDKVFTLLTLEPQDSSRRIDATLAAEVGSPYLGSQTLGALLAAEARATAETLAAAGRPVRRFHLANLDEAALGALMMHAMLETVITAHGLRVDPFDQPAVERGKQLTRRYLSGDGS